MYGPTDLKKNTLITLDGQPYKVVEYSQKVMGRGGSIVNVKVKNLITGALLPKTFKGQEKIEPAEVTTRKVQYLYKDDEKFYFMDPESFEKSLAQGNLYRERRQRRHLNFSHERCNLGNRRHD